MGPLRNFLCASRITFLLISKDAYYIPKVIREKSRGEGSLIVQDTIENVSEPKFFFAHENMKKPASKVAEPAQISILVP